MSPRFPLACRRRPNRRFLAAFAAAALLVACDSSSDTVCQDIANCSHGGSDDWVTACRTQADDLEEEAKSSGCKAAYDAYFACAQNHFVCRGNQSRFDGCDGRKDELDACLTSERALNACGELDAKLAACGTTDAPSAPSAPAPDAPADDTTLEPCTTGGVCSAQCYATSIANVCAPTPSELSAFADCASHCVP
jgi:hypothetical protein